MLPTHGVSEALAALARLADGRGGTASGPAISVIGDGAHGQGGAETQPTWPCESNHRGSLLRMDAADAIAAARRVLTEEPNVRWAYVFGSIVRGGPFRDVDVAVMPMPEVTLAELGAWIAALERAVDCKIDLVDLTSAELPFVGPMLRERSVIVDRDPAARHAWEASTTSRWLDFEPSYREFLAVRERAAQLRRERSA